MRGQTVKAAEMGFPLFFFNRRLIQCDCDSDEYYFYSEFVNQLTNQINMGC